MIEAVIAKEVAKEAAEVAKTAVSEVGKLPDKLGRNSEVRNLAEKINSSSQAGPSVERLNTKKELTEAEKAQIMKETGWPSEIVDCIKSMEQYDIYKNANLHYAEIDGRPCLIRDIDMEYVDPKTIDAKHPNGITNRELMKKGRSPFDAKTGERIELHHMGQDFDSPFAELTENLEHGDGNDTILHEKDSESWRRDPEKKNQYNNVQRPQHWIKRSEGD